MKVLSKVLLITLLATVVGLSGCDRSQISEVKKSAIPLLKIKPSSARKSATVLFPQKANIKLVGGVSKIGWANINLKAKRIEVSSSNDSETIDFTQIQKINFDLNRAIFSNGNTAIEAEKSPDLLQQTWTHISLDDFKSEEDMGEVMVKLNNSALSKNFVVQDGIYVVEEIGFDESSQKMALKVLCCTAKY
ncbi:MAG: hypothetical protein AAF630_21150 [Cyanobacteria bacterium P01_C01_bin.38]